MRPRPPLFILYFENVSVDLKPSNRPENRFINRSLIPSSETLTLLNFALRICPQCCMLHLLKSGREGGGLGHLFLNFLDPPLSLCSN